MKLKKTLVTSMSLLALTIPFSVSATPTMTQSVTAPQYLMNPNNNPNYVLVWSHLDSLYYIDLSSIVVKQNDNELRWWAQNVVELTPNGEFVKQYTQDLTHNMEKGKNYFWNRSTRDWEVIDVYDLKSRNQFEARSFELGYIFALQGGNPVEK